MPPPNSMESRLARLEAELQSHKEICTQRQGTILQRLSRMEAILLTATGSLIGGLLWLVFVRHGI